VNILGINYIFHDTSACIVSDGDLVAAMEEERLTRKKHTTEFPRRAIAACLRQAKLSVADIDHIAVSVQPEKMLSEKLAYAARLKAAARSFLAYEFDRPEARHITFWTWLYESWPAGQPAPEVSFIEHHIAHAAGSYFLCPWEKAALLSVDGWGEWTTTWLGTAVDLEVRKIAASVFPHSLGMFYSAATQFCGFRPNYDEGKTMGLAPTGDADRFYRDVSSMIEITPAGQVHLDMSWFAFEGLDEGLCSEKLHSRLGTPRKQRGPIEQHHKDVAAAFQRVLEEKVLALCHVLEKSTDAEHLVVSGGVALNSVMNGRLLRETRFRDLYVMPGAGDNGTCMGAAYALYNGRLQQSKRYHHNDPYIGTEYSDEQIRGVLTECKVSHRRSTDICRETAALLRSGRIVGWFQGRMEFGARALGNRSILANPSIPDMKERINAQVKHREPFRPFAPSVPVEHCGSYFDIRVDSPFMLKVCPVREHRRRDIPAVTHVDGSARVQTVERTNNGRYHELLTRFGELAGHPVLLNTSFNVMDEPIVESPLDALRCFFSTGLDDLVIGDYLINK
jgi:carbamoyltransferase